MTRWARVILSVVVVGAVLGLILTAFRSGGYTSQAVVQIRPIVSQSDDPNLDTSRQINAATEEAVAGSQRVAELALALRTAAAAVDETGVGGASTDGESADGERATGALDLARLETAEVVVAARDLAVDPEAARRAAERTAVSVVPDSQILTIEASADDRVTAQAVAQSTALAYLQFRRDQATAGTGDSRFRLESREAELVDELDALARTVDAVPSGMLAYADVAQRQELAVIGTKFANLEALTVDPGVVLTDAGVARSADGLPRFAGPIVGALLGLVGAITAVLLIDRTDDRLRDGRLELSALGVPMLGSAPAPRRPRASIEGGSKLYAVDTDGSDAYRRLQGTLLFNLDNDSKSVVLVAGVNDSMVATSVAANVGATAARAGRRTLLIGGDLRGDQLGRHLGARPGTGLSDVIVAGASLAESIQPVDGVDNLGVLIAGSQRERPADVLQSQAFARLMDAVQADYDLVVVEGPPVLQVADAVDIAALCDATVVVANGDSEKRQSIVESVEQLRAVGSDVVGVVVADTDLSIRKGRHRYLRRG